MPPARRPPRDGVVTNDIYTNEDAEALLRLGVMPADRVVAVETGCCPHTAIRDDVAANLDAVESSSGGCPASTWCWSSPAATT